MGDHTNLSDDLIFNASSISRFVFGNADPQSVKKIYYFASTNALPIFKVGGILAARKSELIASLSAGEPK